MFRSWQKTEWIRFSFVLTSGWFVVDKLVDNYVDYVDKSADSLLFTAYSQH